MKKTVRSSDLGLVAAAHAPAGGQRDRHVDAGQLRVHSLVRPGLQDLKTFELAAAAHVAARGQKCKHVKAGRLEGGLQLRAG